MVASALVDLVKILTTTAGTGPLVLDTAVPSFRGIEALTVGKTYSYSIQTGSNYEYGTGVFDGSTLTRGVVGSSYGNAAIPLTSGATVTFVALAQDIQPETIGPAGPAGPMGPPAIQLAVFFTTALAASEVFGLYVAPADFQYDPGFDGSVGNVGTAPAANMTIDVSRQSLGAGAFATIGTITITSAGAVTFATAGGIGVAIVATDVIKFTGPATPDTATFFTATLRGF
jgi:hypothetical protein